MRKLERHITKLLLDNDCVIVPGFGGFITHHISASYDEKNSIFLPPSRTIGFNSQLVMNDSLLVQEYANTYDISYPEALKCIETDVDNFKDTINNAEGGYEIQGVGRIYLLDDGRYDFLPNSAGITTPRNYGFCPIEMPLLPTGNAEVTIPTDGQMASANTEERPYGNISHIANNVTNEAGAAKKPSEDISVHIPISIFHQLAAACIILFLLLSVPSKLGEAGTASLRKSAIETNWLYEIMPKEKTTGRPDNLSAVPSIPTPKTSDHYTYEQDGGNNTYYSIVLASRITERNACEYVHKLQNEGMQNVRIYKTGKMIKVIYKSFATRHEANTELKKMKSNAIFAGCWITEIK